MSQLGGVRVLLFEQFRGELLGGSGLVQRADAAIVRNAWDLSETRAPGDGNVGYLLAEVPRWTTTRVFPGEQFVVHASRSK